MIIDGTAIAAQIQTEIKLEVEKLHTRKPCLAVLLIGDHIPSQIYVNRKTKACESVGIISIQHRLPSNTSEALIIKEIERLNDDPKIDGILLQLPLPEHINPINCILAISPNKDVDGLHPLNAGKLLIGNRDGFVPCTPLGIQVMLQRTGIDTTGKHAVILGRSNLVGKPLAALLVQNAPGANATVTVLHSQSRNIKAICLTADIVIAAIGKAKFVTADMVKEGAVVIDVGINKIDKQIVGDVDFENVQSKCSFITPVPKGVGPMTIAMLLSNTLKSYTNTLLT